MFFLDVSLCQDPDGLGKIIGFLKSILLFIQIAIPIGLILYGTIDLGKAVIAGDEKEIQSNQKVLFKRVIAAVLVFFVVAIVTFAMGLVNNDVWKSCWNNTNPPAAAAE